MGQENTKKMCKGELFPVPNRITTGRDVGQGERKYRSRDTIRIKERLEGGMEELEQRKKNGGIRILHSPRRGSHDSDV